MHRIFFLTCLGFYELLNFYGIIFYLFNSYKTKADEDYGSFERKVISFASYIIFLNIVLNNIDYIQYTKKIIYIIDWFVLCFMKCIPRMLICWLLNLISINHNQYFPYIAAIQSRFSYFCWIDAVMIKSYFKVGF